MNVWIEESGQISESCWHDLETKDKIIDPVLREAVAVRIANWMGTVAQNQRNAVVVRCGEVIGSDAYIQDDGEKCDDVLCAKVPERCTDISWLKLYVPMS